MAILMTLIHCLSLKNNLLGFLHGKLSAFYIIGKITFKKRQVSPTGAAVFVKITVPLIILIHLAIHLLLSDLQIMQTYKMFGIVPAHFWTDFKPLALITPITHMFVHGDWMHLAFNTVMLAALGTFFAREFGSKVTTIFFFLCGVGGALLFFVLNMKHYIVNDFLGISILNE